MEYKLIIINNNRLFLLEKNKLIKKGIVGSYVYEGRLKKGNYCDSKNCLK